jgi:hypothetical protein
MVVVPLGQLKTAVPVAISPRKGGAGRPILSRDRALTPYGEVALSASAKPPAEIRLSPGA